MFSIQIIHQMKKRYAILTNIIYRAIGAERSGIFGVWKTVIVRDKKRCKFFIRKKNEGLETKENSRYNKLAGNEKNE